MRALTALLLLAACATPPDLAGRLPTPGSVAPPQLVPLGPVLAAADALPVAAPAALDGRLARLAARAALLRTPVLSPADRARLDL